MGHLTTRSLAGMVLAVCFFSVACVDAPQASTGGAPLYVFDGTSHSVLAWNDISAVYDSDTAAAPDRTITSDKLTNFDLSTGGMALDSSNSYLYFVSKTGGIVRISRANSQEGAVSSSDVISMSIDDAGTDANGSGVFGQVAVNPKGETLYVTEANASKSQIWAIPVGSLTDGAKITQDSGSSIIGKTSVLLGTSDRDCTGVAASSDAVYAFFANGGTVSTGIDSYNAPSRLRKGTATGFSPAVGADQKVIVGKTDNATTLLGQYGCLAYDTSNDLLYFARHNTASTMTGNPVLVFEQGSFSPGFDVAPKTTLSGPDTLRIIAHAGQKDWLVGATDGTTSTIRIWKGPSSGDTAKDLALPGASGGTVQILGLALDGTQ